MKSLQQLKVELLADGIIDAAEAAELETVLFADGKIDTEEAELLFELNNAVSGRENHPSWEALFIKGIASYVLDDYDEFSENEIDTDEAHWLHDRIKGDGNIDAIERNLLLHLKEKAINFPELLAELL